MGKPVEPSEPEEAEEIEEREPGESVAIDNREPEEVEYEEDPTQTGWLEISLIDFAGEPVPGERFRVRLESGQVVNGTLDPDGFARIENIPEGTHMVSFPKYDAEAWEAA